MVDPIRDFEQQLRSHGLRVTAERRRILGHALRHFWHFDAEELLDSLRRDGASVSRATVFRTLGRLVDAGVLRRHPLTDGRVFYEPAVGREHHEHLICVECGKILEFVQEEIERLQDEVCRTYRFEPRRHTLQIYGTCEACRTKKTKAAGAAG